MITKLSDSPGPTVAGFAALVSAMLTLASAFGVHITQEQQTAILAVITTGSVFLVWLLDKVSVARTPTSTDAPLQTPPPGTVLVTKEGAAAPGAIKPAEVIATGGPLAP